MTLGMETVYETDVTFSHSHHYKRGDVETGPGPDGHTHPILSFDGHACIIEFKHGHSHKGDPLDLSPLPRVPFPDAAPAFLLTSSIFAGLASHGGTVYASCAAYPTHFGGNGWATATATVMQPDASGGSEGK